MTKEIQSKNARYGIVARMQTEEENQKSMCRGKGADKRKQKEKRRIRRGK